MNSQKISIRIRGVNTSERLVLLALLIMSSLFLLYGCQQVIPKNRIQASIKGQRVNESFSLAPYFCRQSNCTSVFDRFINHSGVVCALHEMNEPSAMLIVNKNRNISIIIEDRYCRSISNPRVACDNRRRYMHDKFCVYNDEVLTGSANPTVRGFNRNDNVVVVINSSRVAGFYRDEFREIKNREGDRKTPDILMQDSNRSLRVLFCPDDNCEQEVIRELDNAKRSVYFLAFSFTNRRIADELASLKKRGVDVEGVVESSQLSRYSVFNILREKGIDIRKDGNRAMMHHKLFIIDNRTIITGSANPTNNGMFRNDENIIIAGDSSFAGKFVKEFMRVKADSR